MSQLTTNTTTLQAILDTVNALPEAGGGTAVETCTVRVSTNTSIFDIIITTVTDGVITTNLYENISYVGGTYRNVVCGSAITVIRGNTPVIPAATISGGAEIIKLGTTTSYRNNVFRAPVDAGAVAEIYSYDAD